MTQLESAKSAERQSEVDKQMTKLESKLAALHDAVGSLCARLVTVLKLSTPSVEVEEKEVKIELVPLADRIKISTTSTIIVAYTINDILKRLEL